MEPILSYEEKLALAKRYLGQKWLLHPANRVKRLPQPLPAKGCRR